MRTVVAVLRGGPSEAYDLSLKSGAAVLEALDRERYEPRDIFIDRAGQWHSHGMPLAPERALRGVDAAFNALHGRYGEDGEVQKTLEALRVPYTGTGVVGSALAYNKEHIKSLAQRHGLLVPRSVMVPQGADIEEEALRIFRSFPQPSIVKPVTGGFSLGVTLADSFHALVHGIKRALGLAPKALVEEYIRGREATVGVLDDFRGEQYYALLPVEVTLPQGRSFHDFETKCGSEAGGLCPGSFSNDEKRLLGEAARTMHREAGLSHYSRSDFIVGKRGVFYLETNTQPVFAKDELFPQSLRAIGSSLPHFVEHAITLARAR